VNFYISLNFNSGVEKEEGDVGASAYFLKARNYFFLKVPALSLSLICLTNC
jgi:hypothetical protein